MPVLECPRCRYPVQGLPGRTCPECGYERPAPPQADTRPHVVQLREIARLKSLRCRHCKTPLEFIDDNRRCAGCGVVYGLPESRPLRDPNDPRDPSITHNARHVPGWIATVVFFALLVTMALLYAVLAP